MPGVPETPGFFCLEPSGFCRPYKGGLPRQGHRSTPRRGAHGVRVSILSDLQSCRVEADHPPHLQCVFFNQADDFQISADPEVSR